MNKKWIQRSIRLVVLCVFFDLAAQGNSEWEEPEIFAVNKESYRTTALPYAVENSAIKNDYEKSPFYLSLDGTWAFRYASNPKQAPVGFWSEKYNSKDWDSMPVPGNWEFNGFGTPFYTNHIYPFPVNPPYVDHDNNPVGSYRHSFVIPKDWDGRRVFLHFEGATSAMYIWINGQKVGYTENAKSPAEFDITQYIQKGENLLACQVYKYSDGSYLEDQDMWRLGGISRSVYLYSTAPTRILDFFSQTDLDKNYNNGIFGLEVSLKNYKLSNENQQLIVTLLDKDEKQIFRKQQSVEISAGKTSQFSFNQEVKNVQKWTAETPYLYTLLISLRDKKNNIIETTSHKIGFRKIEINDGQLFVNGKKVYFKGVNLHEFNYKTGQVVNREVMIRNIQLMKELNVNAVRTSHYPQPPLWYKLCDEYGIYLVDEANLESHGLGYGKENVSNFPEWHAAHIDRIKAVIERDKNHASVIFWSLGNEASNGKAFFDMYDWAKQRDSTRPVQYEQAFKYFDAINSASNTDILAPMYPTWKSMERESKQDLGRPYIMCEYAHAMGNSMGNFQDYWDLMRSSKNMQGGFIWEWYNHGYPAKDEQGRSYWAYGGDLNGYEIRNDANFCMDGIISPDQQYLPHTHIVKKVYQNILFKAKDVDNGIITVVNDFKFTSLTDKNYSYKWVLLKNGKKEAESNFNVLVSADSQKDIKLNLPALKPEKGVEYYLQIFAYSNEDTPFISAGFEVAKEEFAFSTNDFFVNKDRDGVLDITKTTNKVVIKSGNLLYEFLLNDDKKTLNRFVSNEENIFKEFPRLNFWRAPTDNDFGLKDQNKYRIWEAANYNYSYHFKEMSELDGSIYIKYECLFSGIEIKVDLTYTINNDGSMIIDVEYNALTDNLPEMVRLGMIAVLPENYNTFTWYGRGPWENYVDRNQDAFMGIWEDKVANQAFAYYRPQETGNKTDVRWLILTAENGNSIRIDGLQALSVSVLDVRPEDLDPGVTKKQQHWSDIIRKKETILSIDLFQKGIAGLNSWGATALDPYRFGDKKYRYSFIVSVN